MKVYIVSAKRSAVGSFLGTLSSIEPGRLGAAVIKGTLNTDVIPASDIDEVVLGNVLMAGHGQGIARQASIYGDIPDSVPAYGINMICGSGMKSIMTAFSEIRAGMAHLVVAGGTENMSQSPFLLPHAARQGIKMGEINMKDHMVFDALTDAFNGYHMGVTAENIAEKLNITREEQDKFAFESQEKAVKAIDSGRFKTEIVPVDVRIKKEIISFDTDEYPNRTTSLEKLAGLRPAFKPGGTVTAGNSSGLNDGAAVLLVASEHAVEKYGLKPLVEIISVGQGGCDPAYMGFGPVSASTKALSSVNLKLQDMGLIELNEAFAAQALGVIKKLAAEYKETQESILERCNVNGGAIALGHPVGASGARITVTLVHEMVKRGTPYGLASLCIGGGMGTALVVKNCQ